jgi:PAS domain S-box-containing protein
MQGFCKFCIENILRNWIVQGALTWRSEFGQWCWDLKDGLSWDTRTRELFGYDEKSLVNADSFNDAVHSDDFERVESTWRYAIEKKEIYEVTYRMWRPDGELRLMHSSGRCYYDRKGRPMHMMGVCFDLTEIPLVSES